MSGYRGGGGGWSGFNQYMRDKTLKLADQFDERYSRKSSMFEGMTFWSTGRLEGVDFDLRQIITENGGKYEQYGLRNVSHIVASNLALSNQNWKKLLGGNFAKRPFKIVTPPWITESLKAGKPLKESDFLPECLQAPGVLGNYLQPDDIVGNFPGKPSENASSEYKPHTECHDKDTRIYRIDLKDPTDAASVTDCFCLEALKITSPLRRKGYLTFLRHGGAFVNILDFGVSGVCLFDALRTCLEEQVLEGVSGISLCIFEAESSCSSLQILPAEKHRDESSTAIPIGILSKRLLESTEDSLEDNVSRVFKSSGIFLESILLDTCMKLVKSRKLDLAADFIHIINKFSSKAADSNVHQWQGRLLAKANLVFAFENSGAYLAEPR